MISAFWADPTPNEVNGKGLTAFAYQLIHVREGIAALFVVSDSPIGASFPINKYIQDGSAISSPPLPSHRQAATG